MDKSTKLTLSEWRKYEVGTFCRAWQETGRWVYIRSMVVAVLIAAGQWGLGFGDRHSILFSALLAVCIWLLLLLIEFAWKLLRAPALLAKEAEEELASEKAKNKELAERSGQISRQEMLADGERIKRRLVIRHKQGVKNSLAGFLSKMEARIDHIREIGPTKFVEEVSDSDTESLKLIEETASYLKTCIGTAEATLFKSTTGIQYTDGLGWSPKPFTVDKRSSRVQDHYRSWQATIDVLTHRAGQLKEVIKKLDKE